MSRAEQRALEAFPESYSGHNEYDRKCFVYGYEQAEKDCREEIASIKAKLWQEGYENGYLKAIDDIRKGFKGGSSEKPNDQAK